MFFKNGVCQGVAYNDIYKGTYYPAVSIYKNASVNIFCKRLWLNVLINFYFKTQALINFGPKFRFPITEAAYNDHKPVSLKMFIFMRIKAN